MNQMKAIKAPNTRVWIKNGIIHISSPRRPKFTVALSKNSNPKHYQTVMQQLENWGGNDAQTPR